MKTVSPNRSPKAAAPLPRPKPPRAPRKSTLIPATITHERAQTAMSCIVTDMSTAGARIRLTATDRVVRANVDQVPDLFQLFLVYDRLSVRCEVKWRRGDSLGVRFISVPQIHDKSPRRTR